MYGIERLFALVQPVSSIKDRASDKSLFIGMHRSQVIFARPVDDHGIGFTVPVIGRIPVEGKVGMTLIEQCIFGRTQYVAVGLP